MPSWNIHIAQTERLFERSGATAHVVHDRNAFLFGALVPDIYVGYMVPAIEHPIAYRITHFAAPAHIPKPREGEFWDAYIAPRVQARFGSDLLENCMRAPAEGCASIPARDYIPASSIVLERDFVSRTHYPARYEGAEPPTRQGHPADAAIGSADIERSLFDFMLGVWSHLVADNLWNTRVNEFLDARGGKPSEQFRIKKQGDFDWFGKTLPITSFPRDTPRLIAAAAAFPQYELDERTVLMTIGVAHEIVRENQGALDHPPYRLLTSEFFSTVSAEVVETTDRLLAERLQP